MDVLGEINLSGITLQSADFQQTVQDSNCVDLFANILANRMQNQDSLKTLLPNLQKDATQFSKTEVEKKFKVPEKRKDFQNRNSISYDLERSSKAKLTHKTNATRKVATNSKSSTIETDGGKKIDEVSKSAEQVSKSAEELTDKSENVLQKLASDENITDEQKLDALKQDEAVGQFWQALDKETALKLVAVLSSDLIKKSAQSSGEEKLDENPILDMSECLDSYENPNPVENVEMPTEPLQTSKEETSEDKHIETHMDKNSSFGMPDSDSNDLTEEITPTENSRTNTESISEHGMSVKEAAQEAETKKVQEISTQTITSTHQKNESSASSLFSPVDSAKTSEAIDFSDLLKQITTHESAEKQVAHDIGNAVNQPTIKKVVGATSTETGRDLSFAQDRSSETMFSTNNAEAKGEDKVRSTLFSQIVEKAEFFKAPQQIKIMTLQLKPETLGKLEIHLATKDGAVTARISAENQFVKDKIEQLVPQIREHLHQEGVNILQISVDISSNYSDGRKGTSEENLKNSGSFIGSKNVAELGALDSGGEETSVLINPEIRKVALHIKSVDITV